VLTLTWHTWAVLAHSLVWETVISGVMSTRLPDDAWRSHATTPQPAVAVPEAQGPGLKVAGLPYGT
jgi:hypothetical protein